MNLLDNIDKYDKQIFDWGEILWLHEPVESPYLRISVAQIIIYPGLRQEKHFHLGEEQLFFVKKGNGCFYSDGIEEKINPSKIIYIKPFSEHEVINTGDEDLVLHAVYVPIKLMQLERHFSLPVDSNIQDIIPMEILELPERRCAGESARLPGGGEPDVHPRKRAPPPPPPDSLIPCLKPSERRRLYDRRRSATLPRGFARPKSGHTLMRRSRQKIALALGLLGAASDVRGPWSGVCPFSAQLLAGLLPITPICLRRRALSR